MSEEARFSVAAYAVVTDSDNRVLLTRRREGKEWVLPGGSVEESEAPWEAVAREVHEETGLEISEPRLCGVYVKRREQDLVFLFRAACSGGALRTSDERDRVVFLDPGRLPDGTADRDAERVRDALARTDSPTLSIQPSAGDEPPAGTR